MMGIKSKKKLKIIILIIVVLIGGLYYVWYQDDLNSHGRLYASKEKMCMEFAQSYLRTIKMVEPNFDDQKWQKAVAIESDLYNLCQSELTDKSLENFETTNIRRYLDDYRKQ